MAQPTDLEIPPSPAQNAPRGETHSAAPAPPPRRESLFRRPYARTVLIIAVIVLLVGGFFAYNYFSSYESTDDAQVDGHLMPISARIPGYITKVNVDDNQVVKQGTVLAEMDPRDYQVALEKAQADLLDAQATAQSSNINVPITSVNTVSQVSSAQADVENAEAGIAAAQQQYDAAQAQLAQAQANDVKAQADLKRYKQLVDKQEISQQLYDQAVAQANANTAAVAAAKSSAAAAEQGIHQARAKLLQAQANLRATQTFGQRKPGHNKWLRLARKPNRLKRRCSKNKQLWIRRI
jgi:membrane fusion protein (multidrug efflux system)